MKTHIPVWKCERISWNPTVCMSIVHIPKPQPFCKSSHIPKHISGAKYHWVTHFSFFTHKHHHSVRVANTRECYALLYEYVHWILSTTCVKAHRVIYKRMQLKYRLTYICQPENVYNEYAKNESIHDVVTKIINFMNEHNPVAAGNCKNWKILFFFSSLTKESIRKINLYAW